MGTTQPHLLPASARGPISTPRRTTVSATSGSINASANRGGKNYDLFRSAISRLSTVSYRNDHFFDPIRGEHRDVGFGFLSYSLPRRSLSGLRVPVDQLLFSCRSKDRDQCQ